MTSTLHDAMAQFEHPGGYLAAASAGLPMRVTRDAVLEDLAAWSTGTRVPTHYDGVVARSRDAFARLMHVPAERVAIGSQTSVLVGVIAQSAPVGARILCVDGEFSSMVFPFLQRPDLEVRHAPIERLADAIDDGTWLVAFSHIQSSTGVVADVEAIVAAAHERGARTLCDTTQSAGVHPVDAGLLDATVCHAYKWLCCPRGVAFLTLAPDFAAELTPTGAGWYAGDEVWMSCYGPSMALASDARRFDVSPAWQAWAGAEPALQVFAQLDVDAAWAHATRLGDLLCEGVGIAPQHQAIVAWPDPDGARLAALSAAGIQAAGRAGRVRTAFHLWNTERDVDAALRALARV